jgi:Oxidoreductase molybdopterin binding domain
MDAKTAESRGHDTKTPPPSARTAEKMAPESMMEEEKKREMRTGRMPRGREEAGQSHSTLPQPTSGLLLTMGDILRLPRYELVTQFKCIEGWSQIVHWAGVRMADFLEEYPPEFRNGKEPRFVYMETPDGDYYTAYDMQVCRHPQTLLVTEMMGAPLTQYHGAPLRLHMPTKYGYKQIKRIGLISYNIERPDDYWTKLGYDWYAGL